MEVNSVPVIKRLVSSANHQQPFYF